MRRNVTPVQTKTEPSGAGRFWRGGATERARNRAREVTRLSAVRDDEVEFVRTKGVLL